MQVIEAMAAVTAWPSWLSLRTAPEDQSAFEAALIILEP